MALYESTGEVRQPQEGELFLTGFPQLIFTRHVMIASALPASGPRVIMRKVEEASHV